MALFRKKKKDTRVEEISNWAEGYLEELREKETSPETVEETVEELPPMTEVIEPVMDGVVLEEDLLPVSDAQPEVSEEILEVAEEVLPGESGEETRAEVSPIQELEELVSEPSAPVEDVPVTEEVVPPEVEEEVPSKPTLVERLRSGLSKTRSGFVGKIDGLLSMGKKIDSHTLEDLEEILIESDIGVQQSLSLIQKLQDEVKRKDIKDPEKIKIYIRDEITGILRKNGYELKRPEQGPYVIMVVGVNGVGKTTTIAKLAWRYVQAGEQVLLAAGDTFRAAATEQLEIWGDRVGADVVKHKSGSDPSAVVFDALKAAESRGSGVVIADTAGRLHTKVNLMEELKKMKRVMDKVIPGAPHEILLVLDANTGQNAISQARTFHEAVDVTGIVLTKLDGTAKGGIVTAIVGELGLPVKLIGIGEGMEDLRDFDPDEFVSALFDA